MDEGHDSACSLELNIQEHGEMRINGKISCSSLAYIASIKPTTPHGVCKANLIVTSYGNQRQMALDSSVPICSYSGGRTTVRFRHEGTWIPVFEGAAHETILRSPDRFHTCLELAAFHSDPLKAHVVTPWSETHTTLPEMHLHISSDCLIGALDMRRL
jgi:hypothetical protein